MILELVNNNLLLFGIISGLLQLAGYLLYIFNDEIDPNPVTWFMFAYGTGILTLLEWDLDASFSELILPLVCSIFSILVAVKCWRAARKKNPSKWWPEDWWPEDFWEKWSFIGDIFITIAYILAWTLAISSLIEGSSKELAVFLFLFLSNLSTFPSFYPLLKSTYLQPEKEAWLPWSIWALAYGVLGLVTYSIQGDVFNILMFYPLSNFFLHGLVALLALRKGSTQRIVLH